MADIKAEVSAEYSRLIREQTRSVDLESFRERGLTKVNVINARQINELIEKAVEGVIGKLDAISADKIRDEKSQVMLDSMAEFKRLLKEQQEAKANQPAPEEGDRTAKAVVEALEAHMRDLRSWHVASQAKAAQELHQRESEASAAREQLATSLDSLSKTVSKISSQPTGPSAAEIGAAVAGPIREALAPLGESFKEAIKPIEESVVITRKSQAIVRRDLGELAKSIASVAATLASIDNTSRAQAVAAAGTVEAVEQALSHRLKSVAEESKTEAVQMVSMLQSALTGLDNRIEELSLKLNSVQQESSAVEGRLDAKVSKQIDGVGTAVSQVMQGLQAMQGQVSMALERPTSIDPSQLTDAISGAVGQAQHDLLARLERQGLVRSGTSDEQGADAAVASAVVKSAFRELDTGTTESHMGSIVQSREVKGDSGALDRLKKLRGKG